MAPPKPCWDFIHQPIGSTNIQFYTDVTVKVDTLCLSNQFKQQIMSQSVNMHLKHIYRPICKHLETIQEICNY